MKSKKIVAAILTLALTATSVLAGCGNKDAKSTAANETKTENVQMDKEQILKYALVSDPKTMDVSLNNDSYGGLLLISTNEPLTRKVQDEKGDVKTVAGGAESWKVSDDGLTWTFKIRDMKWSDDKPLTAKDYEYSIKRTIDPKTGASYGSFFNMVVNAKKANGSKAGLNEVGVKALDDRTLEIKLEAPCPYFLSLTSFYTFCAQRQDVIEKLGDKYGSDANNVISCGPFVVKDWVHNSKVTMIKNEKYWDAKNVKLQTIELPIIQEENPKLTQMNNGDLDYGEATQPEWIERLKKNDKLAEKIGPKPSIGFMYLNQDAAINGVKLFSNKKVRQGMALAFDREEYVKVVADGLGTPCYSFVPPGIHVGDKEFRKTVASEPLKKIKEDNPDVKKLIVEGLKELGADPDPSKYEITYLFGSTSSIAKRNGEYYQQVIQKSTGFKLKLDFVESKVKTARTQKGDYQMTAAAWNPDYDDPNTFLDLFISTNKTYPTAWKSEKYDELIAKAGKEKDNDKRIEYFKEAEKILVEEAVVLANYYDVECKFMRKGLKGVTDLPMGGGLDFKNAYFQGKAK